MVENLVRKYRQKAGFTLAQLAELSGIAISTINDIEHGAEPRVVTALNVSVEQLWQTSFA